MFSVEERRKIDMAAIRTNQMGIDFQEEDNEMLEESKRVAGEIIRPKFKSVLA
jgi:hypothetical protein